MPLSNGVSPAVSSPPRRTVLSAQPCRSSSFTACAMCFPRWWVGAVAECSPVSSAEPLVRHFASTETSPLVWPHPRGDARGEFSLAALRDGARSRGAGRRAVRSARHGRRNSRRRRAGARRLVRDAREGASRMTEPRRPEELLAIIAPKLARLPRRVVFIGGATTQLFITDPAAPETHATIDVDIVVDASTYSEYMTDVTRELRDLGAREDASVARSRCCMSRGHRRRSRVARRVRRRAARPSQGRQCRCTRGGSKMVDVRGPHRMVTPPPVGRIEWGRVPGF